MTEPEKSLSVSQRLIAQWQLPPEAIREGWRELTTAEKENCAIDMTAMTDDERKCPGCETPKTRCAEWKRQGYVACCPDCKHLPGAAAG
jgi:hypothetical protein